MTFAPNGRRTVLVVEDSPTEQAKSAAPCAMIHRHNISPSSCSPSAAARPKNFMVTAWEQMAI